MYSAYIVLLLCHVEEDQEQLSTFTGLTPKSWGGPGIRLSRRLALSSEAGRGLGYKARPGSVASA